MREHQTVSGCTVTWPCYISVGECIFCCCSGFPFAVLINLTKYCIVFVILEGLLVVIIKSSCRNYRICCAHTQLSLFAMFL